MSYCTVGNSTHSVVSPSSAAPRMSSRGGGPCRASRAGSQRRASTIAVSPIGTLMKKTSRQPSSAPPMPISRPPTSGPTAVAVPTVAPIAPNARPRSAPLNSCCTMPDDLRVDEPAEQALDDARDDEQPGVR